MIDANSQFFAILTNVGMAKQANADALGIPWKFTDMGVGDANNTDPIPSASQTRLINEWRRRPLNQVRVDPANPAVIIAEQIIPADEGGRWIREIGVYDADGDLVAVANCAPTYKSLLSQGSGRTQVVRMNFIVSSTGNITLKIDPAVVLATREYVELRIMEELYKLDSKQSVRVATTANIALAGLQTIDGIVLVAGDRVLVKNQAVAKDNGLYIVAAGVWARAPDANSNAEVTSALLVSVEQGATLADSRWQLVTDGVIVLGVTALTFQNVTQGFAPINSPAFLGTPTAPTAPQFDNSTRLQTTAFAKRMGVEFSGFAPLTASTVLGASSVGGIVACASATPINITLPPTAGVPDGASVEVVSAGAGAVTVLAAGLDVLASQAAGVIPVVLGMGDSAKFVKVAGTWRLRGGSMALKYAAVMSGSNWTTRPQFESSQAFATTEFVKRMGVEWSGFSTVNVNTVLGNGSIGGIVSATSSAAISITLPPTGAVGAGAMIMLVSGGVGSVTLLGSNGENTTNISGSAITVVLGQGDSAILSRVPGEWRLVGGSLALKYAYVMAAGSGANGYQKLPSGLQECRGSFTSSPTPGAPVNVTFPLGFGSVNQLVITPVSTSTAAVSAWHDSATPSGFNGHCNLASTICHYIAKGQAA
ncbi:phage tail protein [Pseudomonas sivasensis]|uniref:phage tail protein n=1 Tax=Pseudomonas sivasensis TaxID=1880678 RepID=UPI0030D75866